MTYFRISGLFFLVLSLAYADPGYEPSPEVPDAPDREFRGVWVTTVHNVDWPSRDNLSMEDQKKEFIAILDRCVELRLNAVVLQVRSQCDTIWPSKIEPWCPWFTGTMGQDPGYDPLAFAIQETHVRGMELHAWFNPFRAINSQYVHPSKDHLAVAQKKSMRYYGDKVWLDPTDDFAKQRVVEIVKEVLLNYDVDAIHMDDYFYPYPIKGKDGKWKPFNDYYSWVAYQKTGGDMSKGDWRRDHINSLIRDLRSEIKEIRPWVKFGISPFGIYRPGQPAQVKNALDTYETLYTDSLLWWQEGWVDYLAPQLYWTTSDPQLGFPGLYDWWRDQNVVQRHLWPGIATYRIKTENRSALESLRQIKVSRDHNNLAEGPGHLHFSMKSLMENVSNVNSILKNNVYLEPVLVPESPWLIRLDPPIGQIENATIRPDGVEVSWKAVDSEENIRWWIVQTYQDEVWKIRRILQRSSNAFSISGLPEQIAITPIGLAGELGKSSVVRRLD